MTNWVNPDDIMPINGDQVLVAISTNQHVVETYTDAYVHAGGFDLLNGCGSPNRLYSQKSPHRAGNAYRVMAWQEIEEYMPTDNEE